VKLLLARLERISADSPHAHKASGIRGSLLRLLDPDREPREPDAQVILGSAFEILEAAAAELTPRQGASGPGPSGPARAAAHQATGLDQETQ
jgi:hypothetical protein